jgi:hypothetical protein
MSEGIHMAEDKSSRFKYWDHTTTTRQLIEAWKPKGCKTHNQYQDSLHQYLTQHLKNVKVIKEYGSGRIRGDIGLDGKLIVEIKVNFDTMAEFQRAVGQIEGYVENDCSVIVVICGRRDDNLISELKKKYQDLNMWEANFQIVEKPYK